MPQFSPEAVQEILEALRPAGADGGLCVAFSGGLDSTALLEVLAELKSAGFPDRLRAIHVNHQLHADASLWQERCTTAARAKGIACEAVTVTVPVSSGDGVEAAARTVRYAVLKARLEPGERLLTAHHADDQLETVLLALMRGSGLRGLAGMPASVPFGAGWHQRPLLAFTREQIESWARARRLTWIEDPANHALHYSRSYLRQQIVPRLRDHWPQAAVVASRSARHLAEADRLLDGVARGDLASTAAGRTLRIAELAALSPPRRRNLLRFWLRVQELPLPATRKLAVLEHDMLAASADRNLCVTWPGAEIRSHRGLLYAGAPLAPFFRESLPWNWREPCVLPSGMGELRVTPVEGEGFARARLPEVLEVDWRAGGERLAVAGVGHRSLKKLLQEMDVLPWWRERLPLIGVAGRTVAVADLWLAPDLQARPGEPGLRLQWHDRPPILAHTVHTP